MFEASSKAQVENYLNTDNLNSYINTLTKIIFVNNVTFL